MVSLFLKNDGSFDIIYLGCESMEGLLIVIFVIIVLICVISIFYATVYNKFQDYIIRINEVESMIDNNLRNKYDLLNRAIPIIKSAIPKDREIFGEVVKLRSRKLGNFELYRVLVRASNEFGALKEEFTDIEKSAEIKKIRNQINEIDLKLDNEIDYYNENISIYNSLLKKFPSNVVASFCKYKEKLFFDRKDMSDEDYDDFKL